MRYIIKKVVQLAFAQDLFDPDHYVSHSFNHSINVAKYCKMLYQNNSIQKAFTDRYPFLIASRIKSLISLHAFLHDCGYPHLKNREKANHAVYSADQTDDIKRSLGNLLAIEEDNFQKLYDDFRLAIFAHNADEGDECFNAKQETDSGHFLLNHQQIGHVRRCFDSQELGRKKRRMHDEYPYQHDETTSFRGRFLDLFYSEDHMLGSQLVNAKIEENPFHIIRIADNLDFSNSRFSAIQMNPSFQQLYRAKFLIHHTVEGEEKTRAEEQYARTVSSIADPGLKHATSLFKKDTYHHFGGCEAVKEVKSITIRENQTVVEVEIDETKWAELHKIKFSHKKQQVSIANFQMYRAAVALSRVFIANIHLATQISFVFAERELYKTSLINEV